MKTFRAYLIFTLLFASIGQAGASVPLGGNRKGNGGSYDLYGCMQSNDYYVVNFAAYQLDPSQAKDSKTLPQAECIDLPMTGKTQISIDILDLDVRKKPVALKILREEGKPSPNCRWPSLNRAYYRRGRFQNRRQISGCVDRRRY